MHTIFLVLKKTHLQTIGLKVQTHKKQSHVYHVCYRIPKHEDETSHLCHGDKFAPNMKNQNFNQIELGSNHK